MKEHLLSRSVVVGGAGAVGALFAEALGGVGSEVSLVDRLPPKPGLAMRYVIADATQPGAELERELNHADLVVLAVPEPVVLAAIYALAPHLPPGALLVDTASVKSRVCAATLATRHDVQAISVNPMFAPSSGFGGQTVAAVVVRAGRHVDALLSVLEQRSARVVLLDPDQHDRLAATCQALTHAVVLAFGSALTRLGVEVDELEAIAPKPCITMLSLLARIVSGTPEVYWDVQTTNPYAAAARGALADGVSRMEDLLTSQDDEAFAAVVRTFSEMLGAGLSRYTEGCAQMFKSIDTARPNGGKS